ncbi:hypothetical protein [Streptacidiphilus sp. MAP12-33]|uniref:hypothetical protein n=1 Tax=Streptacidiphilus sp. MAP12-33 TaxID=3156266 RepID=UPI003517C2B5
MTSPAAPTDAPRRGSAGLWFYLGFLALQFGFGSYLALASGSWPLGAAAILLALLYAAGALVWRPWARPLPPPGTREPRTETRRRALATLWFTTLLGADLILRARQADRLVTAVFTLVPSLILATAAFTTRRR